MPAFRTIADLRRSLDEAGLGAFADRIVATVRPGLVFVRQQAPDDALPVGISKLGGLPSLPDDAKWPTRPPLPQADTVAASIRDTGATVAQMFAENPDLAPDMSTKQAGDAIRAQYEKRAEACFREMPLAFVAQLNLAALSLIDGFPSDFPMTGLLTVFTDVSANETNLFWYDKPDAELAPRRPPQELIDYHDTVGNGAGEHGEKWASMSMGDVLYPLGAFFTPDHWANDGALPSQLNETIQDWARFGAAKHVLNPEYRDIAAVALAGPDALGGNFGDCLGGWPADIQGNAETDLDGVQIAIPGRTRWRQIFSYGGESYGGLRLISPDFITDGATYLFLAQDDLAASLLASFGEVWSG